MTHEVDGEETTDPTAADQSAQARSTLSRIGFALAAAVAVVLVKYYIDDSFRSQENGIDLTEGELGASYNISDPFEVDYKRCECQSCPNAKEILDPNAPRAIIAGAMKGGTRALLTYLGEHPQVYSKQGSEVHLFDERHFEHVFPEDDVYRYSPKVDQCKVLQTYQEVFEEKLREQKNPSQFEKVFFDKTPSYMEYSHIIPQRILCVLPDVKIIMVLRNPVDRTYSHYQHCNNKHHDVPVVGCKGKTFEESVAQDLSALERAGVLEAASAMEEYDAWIRYHNFHGKEKGNLMIAKSLYAIQLRQWIAVFRDHFGKDKFLQHLLILESEWMHTHKQVAYNQTLEFVGLPQHTLEEDEDFHVGKYEPMKNETRKQLDRFFRPYNQNLNELLSPLGIEFSWARGDR